MTKKEFEERIDRCKDLAIKGHDDFFPLKECPYTCINIERYRLNEEEYMDLFGLVEGPSQVLLKAKEEFKIPEQDYVLEHILCGNEKLAEYVENLRLNCLDLYKEYVISEGLYESL